MNLTPRIENVGAGSQVFKQTTAREINQLRSLTAGANIALTQNANDVAIAVTGITPAPSTIWLEDFLWVTDNAEFNGLAPEGQSYATAGISFAMWKVVQADDDIPFYWKTPNNFDTAGQMQISIIGFTRSVGSSGNHTLRFNGRYHAHNSDPDVAFTNNCDITFLMDTANRTIVSGWTDFSPDGVAAANKMIVGRMQRTDSESDDPYLMAAKIRYRITI